MFGALIAGAPAGFIGTPTWSDGPGLADTTVGIQLSSFATTPSGYTLQYRRQYNGGGYTAWSNVGAFPALLIPGGAYASGDVWNIQLRQVNNATLVVSPSATYTFTQI